MKHNWIFLFLFLTGSSTLASVPRKPLLEEMTSTTCTFCDLSDSVVIAFEQEHGDGISVLKWFNDWHNREGINPFFNNFPSGANRTYFYGVSGVPALCLNGRNRLNPLGYRVGMFDTLFKNDFTLTSPYAMVVNQAMIGDSIECTVHVTLVDDLPLDTSLRIAIVIAERSIYFQEEGPPEQIIPAIHTDVVRATLPDFTSHGAPTLFVPKLKENETKTFIFRKHIDTAWKRNMLRTTAFIQNIHTGEVLQSGSSAIPQEAVHTIHSAITNFALYPNPTSKQTRVSFSLAEKTLVSATLYDIHGKLITTIFGGLLNAGEQSVSFDVSQLPSGVYYSRLQIGEHSETKPLIVEH